MRFTNRWNRLLRWIAGIRSVSYKDFKKTEPQDINRREAFARKRSIPSYSFDTQAFMIKCLDDGWFKSRLKKRMIPLVEKTNWVIRFLMDDSFGDYELDDIEGYTGMDAWRWSRRMDETTNIPIKALQGPQPEYNMDVDVLHANLDW